MWTTDANRLKVLGKTVGGKTLMVGPVKNSSLLRLYFSEGGELPDYLKTSYSTYSDAVKAGDKYLELDAARAKAEEEFKEPEENIEEVEAPTLFEEYNA